MEVVSPNATMVRHILSMGIVYVGIVVSVAEAVAIRVRGVVVLAAITVSGVKPVVHDVVSVMTPSSEMVGIVSHSVFSILPCVVGVNPSMSLAEVVWCVNVVSWCVMSW